MSEERKDRTEDHEVGEDTRREVALDMVMDILRDVSRSLKGIREEVSDISKRIDRLEERQRKVEDSVVNLTRNLDTIYKFQQGFAIRLRMVEEQCASAALETPVPFED